MNRKHGDGHSRDNRLLKRVAAVTPSQASAIATRLLQWKKQNEAKREVKARLQEDARVEEEESFHLLYKTLPQSQVQVAAVRNYRAADELRWKKLLLQAVAKQQQLDEEKIECTFRPHLVTRSRGSVLPTQPKLRTCRSSCATVTNSSAQQPSHRHGRSTSKTDENVFERLYKPHAQVSAVTDSQTDHSPVPKRISSQTEAAFIIRQERDLIVRQRRRSERASQQRFSHKPKLSRHTQEICAALCGRGTDNPVQQADAYGMKRNNPHVRYVYTVPASSMSDSHCNQVSVATAPFSSVIKALRQQEQQMRCIS